MKKALKYTLIGLGVIFLLGIIGAAIGGGGTNASSDSKSNPTTNSSSSDNNASNNTKSNEHSYSKILEWSGNGTKKSSTFELHGNPARLRYKYKSDGAGLGMFSVYVVHEGDDIMEQGGIPEIMSEADHEDTESALHKSSGKYYLHVNATGRWSIIVEEEQ